MPNSRSMIWLAALTALASCAPLTTLPEPPDAAGAPVEAPPARAEVPDLPAPTATPASDVLPIEPAPTMAPSPALPTPSAVPSPNETGWDEDDWDEPMWGDWGWYDDEKPTKRKKQDDDEDGDD